MPSIQEMAEERDRIFWILTHTEQESSGAYGGLVNGSCETHVHADSNKRDLLRMIELDREIQHRTQRR